MKDWTDEQILMALELRAEGHSFGEIGKRFGRSKNSVIGLVTRVNAQIKKHDREGIGNGTMPRYWWQERKWAS